MEWLAENWVAIVVFIAFIALHIFGHGGHGAHGGGEERSARNATARKKAGLHRH